MHVVFFLVVNGIILDSVDSLFSSFFILFEPFMSVRVYNADSGDVAREGRVRRERKNK